MPKKLTAEHRGNARAAVHKTLPFGGFEPKLLALLAALLDRPIADVEAVADEVIHEFHSELAVKVNTPST